MEANGKNCHWLAAGNVTVPGFTAADLGVEFDMTIRVTVKNEDSRENAVIVVQTQNQDGAPQSGSPDKELKGGESADCWVHSGQQLLVKETRNG